MGMFGSGKKDLFGTSQPSQEDSHPVEPERKAEPEESYRPAPPARSYADDKGTVIGKGQIFEGKLLGEGFVRIDGRLDGDIDLDGSVSVSVTGVITGTTKADAVHVAGHVKGNILASGKVKLASSCTVDGDISAGALTIEEGAHFNGRSTMIEQEKPAPEPAPPDPLPPAEELLFGDQYEPAE